MEVGESHAEVQNKAFQHRDGEDSGGTRLRRASKEKSRASRTLTHQAGPAWAI